MWQKAGTHRRGPFQEIISLWSFVSSTSFGEWGSGLPNLTEDESDSSWRCQFEGSVPQTDAAALTRPKTSPTGGRSVRSACQQSSSTFQTLSERPSSSPFAGFGGLIPSKTIHTILYSRGSPNGIVPVSTYAGGIGKGVRLASPGTYLVDCHSHRVYVGFFRRDVPVQSEPGWD